jgi:hypothetical protein
VYLKRPRCDGKALVAKKMQRHAQVRDNLKYKAWYH